MSSIRFHDVDTGDSVPISGTERAHMSILLRRVLGLRRGEDLSVAALNRVLADHPPLRLLARIHGQCEIGCWVAGEDRSWFAALVRQACESVVRVRPYPDEHNAIGSEWSEELLRVGFSTYGDEGGWWRLTEWLRASSGDVVLSESSARWPWPTGEDDELRPGSPQLSAFLRAQHVAYRMQPADWETYRFGGGA